MRINVFVTYNSKFNSKYFILLVLSKCVLTIYYQLRRVKDRILRFKRRTNAFLSFLDLCLLPYIIFSCATIEKITLGYNKYEKKKDNKKILQCV